MPWGPGYVRVIILQPRALSDVESDQTEAQKSQKSKVIIGKRNEAKAKSKKNKKEEATWALNCVTDRQLS